MNTLWQDLRDGGSAISRAAVIAVLAALTLVFGVSATRVSCADREQRYAVQEVAAGLSAEVRGRRDGSHVRYLDYRDRSVPLLVW